MYGFQKACYSSLLLHRCLKHITDVIMTETSPGPSPAVELVSRQEVRIIKLCIICQKVIKDSNRNSKLSSTPEGRGKIVQTSNLINDDLLINIAESNSYSLQYQ